MNIRQTTLVLLNFILFSAHLVYAQTSEVKITTDKTYRYIKANGIPDHKHGKFPNPGNPNSITAQNYQFRVPLNPKVTGISSLDRRLFGVALNGVPFDPGAAEFWNNDRSSGWQYEALSGKINLGLDKNNAHVQPNGSYHYHGIPVGFVQSNNSSTHSKLVGYAADGFPVYAQYGYKDPNNSSSGIKKLKSSYQLRKGTRPSGPKGTYDGTFVRDYEFVTGVGDLDDCNGRKGVTPEYPNGTYYYVLTDDFPFIPRCLRGEADSSFTKTGMGTPRGRRGQNRRGPHRGSPPPEAQKACAQKSDGSSCQFRAPHGTVRGSCRDIQGIKACVPQHDRGRP